MSTDYTKRFRFWRLTFSVSLPLWMKSIPAWLFHPIETLKELQRLRRQEALEKKWEEVFSNAFKSKSMPEFEFDEVHPQRVVGLKETPNEAKLPSIGVWSANENGALDRAIRSSDHEFPMEPTEDAESFDHIVKYLNKCYEDNTK